jgi:hypothetical protein
VTYEESGIEQSGVKLANNFAVRRKKSMDLRNIHQKLSCFFLVGILVILTGCSTTGKEEYQITEQPLQIADFGLFDLGVTDINNDNNLDIFTVNHSGRQSLLLNDGSGGFQDVFSTLKMDQDPLFPGLMVVADEPPADKAGVYINWSGPELVVRSHKIGENTTITGRIEILSSVVVGSRQNFDVAVDAREVKPEVTRSVIKFAGHGDGFFSFKPYIHALPIYFNFDTNLTADQIFVGACGVSPDALEFAIHMRDRHGMAWMDYNEDNRVDVFITRGGLRGTMANIPLDFWDELFVSSPSGMHDIGMEASLAKDGCPGRQTAWVDYNSDNRLDLYVSCGRETKTETGLFPNKLFAQTEDGQFVDVAEQVGLNLTTDGTFVWLDADLDGDMDLFWADEDGFALYENQSGKFAATYFLPKNRHGKTDKLCMADYDNDGDFDVFSASMKGNVFFLNDEGTFFSVEPQAFGLPARSETANWVDYDNDGLLDLHSVPGGLYKQKNRDKFLAVSSPETRHGIISPYKLAGARAVWFDADNNGSRDLVLAAKYVRNKQLWAKIIAVLSGEDKRFDQFPYFWETKFFVNNNHDNHWVQVQPVGPSVNHQSIGARVTVVTPNGEQLQQVGEFEGSHYSQGHYRLYFGLGSESRPSRIRVRWQDGKTREIQNPPGDQLIKIFWRDAE